MSFRTVLVGMLVVSTVVAASSALAAADSKRPFRVTSSLDGKSALPLRIHWTARPRIANSKVRKVDFLIDGRLGWVEHNAPYVYGDDGNWLVTSFLKPGPHRFAVRAVAYGGRRALRTVTATVSASPDPPAALAGTWSRIATDDDLTKCTSGNCPPTGTWTLRITSTGWSIRDPESGGGLFDVGYPSDGQLQMRPTIEAPPYPNPNNGGWCSDTDPLSNWTATPAVDGSSLSLRPVGQDPCGDRAAILEGTWSRLP